MSDGASDPKSRAVLSHFMARMTPFVCLLSETILDKPILGAAPGLTLPFVAHSGSDTPIRSGIAAQRWTRLSLVQHPDRSGDSSSRPCIALEHLLRCVLFQNQLRSVLKPSSVSKPADENKDYVWNSK